MQNATADVGRNLEARVATVKAVQDETSEWLEAAATAVGNDAQSALGRLRDLIGSVESLKGEIRQLAADGAASDAESRASLMGRVNEVVTGLSEARSAGVADRLDLRRELVALKEALSSEISSTGNLVDTKVSALGASMTSDLSALSTSVSSDLGVLGAGLKDDLSSIKQSVAASATATAEVLAKGAADVQTATVSAIEELKGSVEEWKATVASSTTETETKLLRALESIDGGVSEARSLGAGIQQQIRDSIAALTGTLNETHQAVQAVGSGSGHTGEAITRGLSELEGKLVSLLEGSLGRVDAAAVESRESLASLIGDLSGNVEGWHAAVGTATSSTESKLVRSLEALEAAITARSAGAESETNERLIARLDDLENKLDLIEQLGEQRDGQIEDSVRTLVQTIDDWRSKGRQAADRSKERVSASLEALEGRILESREDYTEYQNMLRKELAALTDAVDALAEGGRDTTTVMRGLEELDEGLLRNRDDVAHLADTFESQFEIFEARIGDGVAARLDELERRMQERNKALVTLLLGPKADNSTTAAPEPDLPRRTHEPTRTPIDRPGQQARRRR